jgi:hypothetical protein
MTLENYMTNWYGEYTRGLAIGQKLKSYSNRIFKIMQEQWDNGTYKESLIRDLANATWLATQAPEGLDEPTIPTPKEDEPEDDPEDGPEDGPTNQGQLDFEKEPAGAGDGKKAGDLVGAAQGKSRGVDFTESKTQSALRAEKIPALKTR